MSECGATTKVINDINAVVNESIRGVILTNPNVITLNFSNVVVIKNYEKMSKLKIISGGGAGHEPLYAGFVGNGLLTAAIHGEIYTSPTSSDIFRLLKELSLHSNIGILAIIQNHSGERLHFGLAVEKAKNEGIRVQTVVVDDDCYFHKSWKGRSGLSGIILVQKIAGALADMDKELEEVTTFCEEVVNKLRSISFSLKRPSVVPGICICSKINEENCIEIGTTLNGQPGNQIKYFQSSSEICKYLLKEITSSNVAAPFNFEDDVEVVVLVNNFGTTTVIEEFVFMQDLLAQLYKKDVKIARVYCGRFVTALDSAGFSITFLKVFDPSIIQYLDAPCDVPVWGKMSNFKVSPKLNRIVCAKYKPENNPIPEIGPKLTERGKNTIMMVLQFACDALYSCEKQINTIDLETGDGDAGTRIKKGMEAIDFAIKSKTINLSCPYTLLKTLSTIVEKNIEGPLGLIYGVFFEAASNVFRTTPDTDPIDLKLWKISLTEGTEAIRRYTKTEAGNRTIYDPLFVCCRLLEHDLSDLEAVSVMEIVALAVAAAEETAQKTKIPYAKYPDPGAHTVAIWLRAVFEGLKCRWIED